MTLWLYRWGPAIIIMGIIFIASSTPGTDLPDFGYIDFFAMKAGHLLGYTLLSAAFLHALSYGRPITRSRIAVTWILVILYAISDEWHQSFTPERNPALLDLSIDTAGGFLGVAFLYIIRKRLRHTRKGSS
jgi:VanZ family protein